MSECTQFGHVVQLLSRVSIRVRTLHETGARSYTSATLPLVLMVLMKVKYEDGLVQLQVKYFFEKNPLLLSCIPDTTVDNARLCDVGQFIIQLLNILSTMHSYQHALIGHTDYPWAVKMLAWKSCQNIIRNCSCMLPCV